MRETKEKILSSSVLSAATSSQSTRSQRTAVLLDSGSTFERRIERGTLELPKGLQLHFGGSWPEGLDPVIAWERVSLRSEGSTDLPTVVVLGGISAGRHVCATDKPGWWSDFVGPEKAVDPLNYSVLSFDYLGGNGESIGPRSLSLRGEDSTLDWPAIDARDQAVALSLLLDSLEIPRIESLIGSSYGGAVALAFGELYSDRVRQLVVIGSADRSHPQTTAYRSLQRQLVRDARERGQVARGLSQARAIAMIGYRTAEEFGARFDGSPRVESGRHRFPVEDYLEARGQDFVDLFDPQAFLNLSESLDLHHIDPASISVPTQLVAFTTDQIVPMAQMRRLRDRLCGPVKLHEVSSVFGHDAFLKEINTVGRVLECCLEEV